LFTTENIARLKRMLESERDNAQRHALVERLAEQGAHGDRNGWESNDSSEHFPGVCVAARMPEEDPMSEATKGALPGVCVLVAEDNLLSGEFIRQILVDLGCTVVGPMDGLNETLRAIQTNDLDGALLDVQLGDANIYPAAHELALRGIPFILLTGRSSLFGLPSLLARAPLLTKPFDVSLLEVMVSRTFRPRAEVVRQEP
jgi:CheY-like chemotaxis protein